MLRVFLFTLLFSTQILAMPNRFEVWFISVDKTSFIDQILPQTKFSKTIASSSLQCQPMGEYCFDPQVGLYKRNEKDEMQEIVDVSDFENQQKYEFIEPAKSVERNMIDCESTFMFDIFCGKSQKAMKQGDSPLEVWIDISSTMKQVDFSGFDKKCSREIFLERLNQTCPLNEKMKVYYFNEVKKEAGAFDRVCLSDGLNNMKRIKQDVESSKAKNIIIITDIFEANEDFINWIEDSGKGFIKGLDTPMYASQINDELKRVRKFCQ